MGSFRIFTPEEWHWIWSNKGPDFSGRLYGKVFEDGRLPWPVPGDVAQKLVYQGLQTTPATVGSQFSHWDRDGGNWTAIFTTPQADALGETDQELPILPALDCLPKRLPDEYVALLQRYTKSGKLRNGV